MPSVLYITILSFLALTVAQVPTGKWFDRIFIMTFENMRFGQVEANNDFATLGAKGMLLTNFHGITHPSQPNYWCQVAGHYFKETNNHVDLDHSSVADLMDEKGVSWKTYQEDYPGDCFDGDFGKYRRKHNPFISFNNIRLNATRCANIVNSQQLDVDLEAGTLPQYSFYTPNMDNDGHDTDVNFAGAFATKFFNKYLDKFPNGTLIVVSWDESSYNIGTNAIYTFLIGSMIDAGTSDDSYFNHYSLLKTVEDNWGLGSLGRGDNEDANMFNFGVIPVDPPTDYRLMLIFGPHTVAISFGIVAGLLLIGFGLTYLTPKVREKIRQRWGQKKVDSVEESLSEQSISLEENEVVLEDGAFL